MLETILSYAVGVIFGFVGLFVALRVLVWLLETCRKYPYRD